MTITHSIIKDNTTSNRGGGVYKRAGDLNLINSAVTGNFAGTFGGGLFQRFNTLNVINSAFSDNTADSGGAIYSDGRQVNLTNSTLSGNAATAGTGGGLRIAWNTTAVIVAGTIVSNTASTAGGGIFQNSNPVTISNTILANNSDTNGSAPDCGGTISSGDYNLLEDPAGCTFVSLTNDITGTAPMLGPLADNGGDTETHALLGGSPALDKVPYNTNGCGTTIAQDQRGVTRPQSANCDIGAFELAYACFVEISDDNVTDFASPDASAVQQGVDAANPGDTVKVAGYCAGVQVRNSLTQTVYISQNVTIRGGYTTDWTTSDPDTYPTILDAEGGGRVVYIPGGNYTITANLRLTGGRRQWRRRGPLRCR